MGAVAEYRTLEHVAQQARPYPAHLLEGCETGLCLFAAAYLGHNDAVHMAEAGMRVTCVDKDANRLYEMENLYPVNWTFRAADAWEFASEEVETYDVVSVDTFTGDAETRSLGSLNLWCSLATKAVTVTITTAKTYLVRTPEGWKSSLYPRAASVYWLVLERQ